MNFLRATILMCIEREQLFAYLSTMIYNKHVIEIQKTALYENWFRVLKSENVRARINVRLRRLELGNPGDVKPVGQGISELRIDYGPGYRVYFMQKGKKLIILLAGGDKRTQNTDIKTAHELAQLY